MTDGKTSSKQISTDALSLLLECVYTTKTALVSTPKDIPDFL